MINTVERRPAHLAFLKKYVPLILAGRKTATVRRLIMGRKIGPWLPEDHVSATCGGKMFAVIEVLSVEALLPDEISDADARTFGAETAQESRDALREFYPEARVLQVIRFRVVATEASVKAVRKAHAASLNAVREGAPVPVVYDTP